MTDIEHFHMEVTRTLELAKNATLPEVRRQREGIAEAYRQLAQVADERNKRFGW